MGCAVGRCGRILLTPEFLRQLCERADKLLSEREAIQRGRIWTHKHYETQLRLLHGDFSTVCANLVALQGSRDDAAPGGKRLAEKHLPALRRNINYFVSIIQQRNGRLLLYVDRRFPEDAAFKERMACIIFV